MPSQTKLSTSVSSGLSKLPPPTFRPLFMRKEERGKIVDNDQDKDMKLEASKKELTSVINSTSQSKDSKPEIEKPSDEAPIPVQKEVVIASWATSLLSKKKPESTSQVVKHQSSNKEQDSESGSSDSDSESDRAERRGKKKKKKEKSSSKKHRKKEKKKKSSSKKRKERVDSEDSSSSGRERKASKRTKPRASDFM
jgi:hypothetical protein